MTRRGRGSKGAARRPAPEPSGGRPDRLRRALAVLAAVLAALALVSRIDWGVDRVGASKRLRVVTVISAEMERTGKTPPELVSGNLRLLREAERLDPNEVGVPVALAGQYMLLGHYDQAAEGYRQALALEARPEVYLNLGNALFASGHSEEAREAYRTAVVLAPRLRRLVPGPLRGNLTRRAK